MYLYIFIYIHIYMLYIYILYTTYMHIYLHVCMYIHAYIQKEQIITEASKIPSFDQSVYFGLVDN